MGRFGYFIKWAGLLKYGMDWLLIWLWLTIFFAHPWLSPTKFI